MTKTSILLIVLGSFFLLNCEKPDPECYLEAPSIFINGEIANDEPVELALLSRGEIHLSTDEIEGYKYHWTGPNGFESNLPNPVISNATDAMSGEYKLSLSKGICLGQSTATVEVSTMAVPCSPQNNRLVFSGNISWDAVNFNSIYRYSGTGFFEINAGGSNSDLTISFSNSNLPSTGVYQVASDCPSSFITSRQVCVSLVYRNHLLRASQGEIYVTQQENGKYSVQFCDINFNPTSNFPYTLTGSTKIIEQ